MRNGYITLRRGGLLLLCLGCLIIGSCLSCGCAMLDAYKGQVGYNHKTGQMDGSLKGAGKGGEYNENTGLNLGLDLGDNTVPALIVAGGLGVLALSAYPVQRALRLRRERKWQEQQARQRAELVASLSSESPSVSPPLTSKTT